MYRFAASTLDEWRDQARSIIAQDISPAEVTWDEIVQNSLFGTLQTEAPHVRDVRAPPAFFSLARQVSCYRDPRRWDLLYQLLWRLNHGERYLLDVATDPLVHALSLMEKAVRRDAHKMKAFVRFRLVESDDGDMYVAWHRPDHRVVKLVAPFFARRFAVMRWTVLTPDETVQWDGAQLTFGDGAEASQAPPEDATEDLWRDYYRAIFNPARIKVKAMKREMPVRHWKTMPETRLIPELLAEAPRRVETMIQHQQGSASSAYDFLPQGSDLETLRAASRACEGCELHQMAHQTVFGEGPVDASLMLVGEQPGHEEDLSGSPFKGPSGALLNEALEAAGLRREDIYITNAVKHFRFAWKEKYRIHKTPSRSHIHACKPWLDAEINAVQPKALLCLGTVAARALIAPGFAMHEQRGSWTGRDPVLSATFHPAAILRADPDQQDNLRRHLFSDIAEAARLVRLLKHS